METRPLEEFDIHEVNRLIMREQIPGFKMLPEEEKYLQEYREALKQLYVGEPKGRTNEVKRQIVPTETSDEVEVEVKRPRKTSKRKKTVKKTEEPVSE